MNLMRTAAAGRNWEGFGGKSVSALSAPQFTHEVNQPTLISAGKPHTPLLLEYKVQVCKLGMVSPISFLPKSLTRLNLQRKALHQQVSLVIPKRLPP